MKLPFILLLFACNYESGAFIAAKISLLPWSADDERVFCY
jgi:hypothetical protein